MGYQTPKLAQDVRRLRMEIENAVRGFHRFHKYSSGDDLREQVKVVQRAVSRSWNDKERQAQWLEKLVHEVDQLKADMQLAQDVRAFRSLRQFQHLYLQVDEIGRQAGGWFKQKHPSAQNPQRQHRSGARPDTEYPRHPNGVNS